jgi:hypothetical protein
VVVLAGGCAGGWIREGREGREGSGGGGRGKGGRGGEKVRSLTSEGESKEGK